MSNSGTSIYELKRNNEGKLVEFIRLSEKKNEDYVEPEVKKEDIYHTYLSPDTQGVAGSQVHRISIKKKPVPPPKKMNFLEVVSMAVKKA